MCSDNDSTKQLWMGDLEAYMDEPFLTAMFGQFGFRVQSIRWIKNYQTGLAARYCFVEFSDDVSARKALESLNGQMIPGTSGTKRFKLNWANRKADSGQVDYNVFVADISRDVTSQLLLEFFQQHYKSIRYAKVVEDEEGMSKGYGFLRFTDEKERDVCLVEMDGAIGLGRKPLTIKPALTPKTRVPANPEIDGAVAMGKQVAPAIVGPTWHHSSLPPHLAYQFHPITPHVSMPPMVYIEDLVDPNTPQSQDNQTVHMENILYMELEACRWLQPLTTRTL